MLGGAEVGADECAAGRFYVRPVQVGDAACAPHVHGPHAGDGAVRGHAARRRPHVGLVRAGLLSDPRQAGGAAEHTG